ncbi:uncharacterized protein ATNIH1004_002050 [Aspergillus tanneri]|uniref:Uncharacterized protein n=1 Tax=Aspergillus tanneri TaxID=1220188 RepID=A0A5M9M752_9EURO|nr:uncharacterized protein ATNIH1004_002050 [Aspergillus tanneri]KAA8641310.1 hypothetical protein ATNIH1004_002050 [Aspergillus tanneri]
MAPSACNPHTEEETNIARDVVVSCHPNTVIDFHEIYLLEPPKYRIIGSDKIPSYEEAVIDVENRKCVKHKVVAKPNHAALTLFDILVERCFASPLFKQALAGSTFLKASKLSSSLSPLQKASDDNFYSLPSAWLSTAMDVAHTQEIIRVDQSRLQGRRSRPGNIIGALQKHRYVPTELLLTGTRKDLKPLNVKQPMKGRHSGFTNESLVEWRWRFAQLSP